MEQQLQLFRGHACARVGDRDTQPARRNALETNRHSALRPVVLHGVREEIEEDLREPLTIREHGLIAHRVRPNVEGNGALQCERLHEIDDALHDIFDRHWLGRQREPTRFDAGDVEHFVDEIEQMLAAVENLPHGLGLLATEVSQFENLSEAEHGVERRSQVVAHARQELVFRASRALGFEARELQLVFRSFAFRHIVGDGADRVHLARGVAQRKFTRGKYADTIGLQQRLFELKRAPLGDHPPIVLTVHIGKPGCEQLVVSLSENFVARSTE